MRRADAPGLVGAPTRARDVLGWKPTVSFDDLVADMVAVDQQRLASGVEESLTYLADRR